MEPPVAPQTCQVPWRELRRGRRSVLASGGQGLDWLPLAGRRAGRGATRALAGRPWHKPVPSAWGGGLHQRARAHKKALDVGVAKRGGF